MEIEAVIPGVGSLKADQQVWKPACLSQVAQLSPSALWGVGDHDPMTYSGGTVVPVIKRFLGVCLVSALLSFPALGQAVAEAAGTTSVSSGITASPKTTLTPTTLPPNAPSASAHLRSDPAPPSQEENRRDLEAKAGKNAGKLLIRSSSGGAEIWIDGRPVGKTPLLLIIAPGKYDIELRGPRVETARTEVALLPRETRE